MQVRNKIFPYPVINHNHHLSNFGELDFDIQFEPVETDDKYILKNVRVLNGSETIKKLLSQNLIEITLIVECSYTVFRKGFVINDQIKDIVLYKADLSERVDVSLFATAKQDFTLTSNEFDDDYKDFEFKIEKYDILGICDGFNITFRHDESEDNLYHSIFSVTKDHNLEKGKYFVQCDVSKKIVITLSEEDYDNYKVVYAFQNYKELFFNMLIVPALIQSLSECKIVVLTDETKDLDDIADQYTWFRSIMNSYKKLKGIDLTLEDFKNCSPVILAQELLGSPLGEALSSLVKQSTAIGDNNDE